MRFGVILLYVSATLSGFAVASEDATNTKQPEPRKAVSYDKSKESLQQGFYALGFLESNKSDASISAIVAYDRRESKIINKKRSKLDNSHPLFVNDSFEADDLLLMQTRLGGKDAQSFYVLYTEGPSADPEFYFVKTDSPKEEWARLRGTALAIPGNGTVYVANRFNNTFTRRTKYLYTSSGLTVVKQPFFYVGLKTHALVPLTLYDASDLAHVVTQLPKGSEIEVLLVDERNNKQLFLIKTPFGLLGWASIQADQYYANAVEGISFWGD